MSAARIVIAAGGTAGHVVPAIAVADALRAEGAEVSFVGGERAESELVPAAGYPLDPIRVEGISRSNPLRAARAAAKAALALREAGAVLRRRRAGAVLGAGGYVAGPVGLAAVLRRVPLVLAEADSHMGLSNRLLAPRARRVCLAFPIPGRDGARYLVTGRPVPPRVEDRAGARAAFGLAAGERCVLVFGGSLGARSVNDAAIAAFADAPYRVLHIAGRRDFPDLDAPGPHYDLRDYLGDEFGRALAAADLAVARAGGSVFELAQYGLPAVLVPYPHATADHQTANARWMERGGAAVVIADGALTPERLRAAVDAILLDEQRFRSMAAASARLARPDAAQDIARAVLAAAGGPTA
jgi:UDP-N-acetylglucosamine--N-acetylmuramyl-(pentapeptide) pyrophosphoryl-undecaprenol N-acetylglucosamine transferase